MYPHAFGVNIRNLAPTMLYELEPYSWTWLEVPVALGWVSVVTSITLSGRTSLLTEAKCGGTDR